MYAKIFRQIFESSIAENPDVRVTFMDMLVLADRHGIVDMTPEAIHRITNRPLEVIRESIRVLEAPDERSRTPGDNGARIRRIDQHRDWGWVIVNYAAFRDLHTEAERREKTLERVRKSREQPKATPESEQLYKLYPRHVAKGPALKAIAKALESTPFETLKKAVLRYAKERQGEDAAFTPYPATWFNQCRWLDEPQPKRQIPGQPRKLAPGEVNEYGETETLTGDQVRARLAAARAAGEFDDTKKDDTKKTEAQS